MAGNAVQLKAKSSKFVSFITEPHDLGHINNRALESIHVLGVIIHLDNLLILETIFHL